MTFRLWLESEDLRGLLADAGQTPQIGAEKIERPKTSNGIAKYVSPHGSIRYVRYLNATPVSILQLVTRDGKSCKIANVYTPPQFRRQHLAAELLNLARTEYQSISHSHDLTDDGMAWKNSVDPNAK